MATALAYAAKLKRNEDRGPSGTEEFEDTPSDLERKLKILEDGIRQAKSIVLHTGAGISTNAGISDFRGPAGVWTVDDQRKQRLLQETKREQSTSARVPNHNSSVEQASSYERRKTATGNGLCLDSAGAVKIEDDTEGCTDEPKEAKRRKVFTKEEAECGAPECELPVVAGGRVLGKVVDFSFALPSLTHCFIKELVESQRFNVCGVISQNVDGLHARSDVPFRLLTEVHGNLFTERCATCHRRFFRDFIIPTIGLNDSGHRCHLCWSLIAEEAWDNSWSIPEATNAEEVRLKNDCPPYTRRLSLSPPEDVPPLPPSYIGFLSCPPSVGQCRDVTLDWDDSYDPYYLETARQWSRTSDFHLCLGSSLFVHPAGLFPLLYRKTRRLQLRKNRKNKLCHAAATADGTDGQIVIVNYQKASIHNEADLVLHGDVDLVSARLSHALSIPIPPYTRYTKIIIVSYHSVFPLLDEQSARDVLWSRHTDELQKQQQCISISSSPSYRRSSRLANKRTSASCPCRTPSSLESTDIDSERVDTTDRNGKSRWREEAGEHHGDSSTDDDSADQSNYRPSHRRTKSSSVLSASRKKKTLTSRGYGHQTIDDTVDPQIVEHQLERLMDHHRRQHFGPRNRNAETFKTTTIVQCGAIDSIDSALQQPSFSSKARVDNDEEGVKIQLIDALRRIWSITYCQDCHVSVKMFYGREIVLRLSPTQVLSATVWKVPCVDKVFVIPPPLPHPPSPSSSSSPVGTCSVHPLASHGTRPAASCLSAVKQDVPVNDKDPFPPSIPFHHPFRDHLPSSTTKHPKSPSLTSTNDSKLPTMMQSDKTSSCQVMEYVYPESVLQVNHSKPKLIARLMDQSHLLPLPLAWREPLADDSDAHATNASPEQQQSTPFEGDTNFQQLTLPPQATLLYGVISNMCTQWDGQNTSRNTTTASWTASEMQSSHNSATPDPHHVRTKQDANRPQVQQVPVLQQSGAFSATNQSPVTTANDEDPLRLLDHAFAYDTPLSQFSPTLHVDPHEMGELVVDGQTAGRRRKSKSRGLSPDSRHLSSGDANTRFTRFCLRILNFCFSHHAVQSDCGQGMDGCTSPSSSSHRRIKIDPSSASYLYHFGIPLLVDLEFFPLWIIGYLADIFDCR